MDKSQLTLFLPGRTIWSIQSYEQLVLDFPFPVISSIALFRSTMQRPTLLLRLSYWTAAIADFAVAVLAWMPERMGVTETAYPMGLASVIAFSWGVLLLMADRKPVERKWILVPTILVVALITVVRTWFSLQGYIALSPALLVFSVALIVLMSYSLWCARRCASNA